MDAICLLYVCGKGAVEKPRAAGKGFCCACTGVCRHLQGSKQLIAQGKECRWRAHRLWRWCSGWLHVERGS